MASFPRGFAARVIYSVALLLCAPAAIAAPATASTDPTSSAPPPVPTSLSRPHVSGLAEQGEPLETSSGAWWNAPTSYSYQWQRCTRTGMRCMSIRDAVGPLYVPEIRDVGHRLRAEVWANNASGPGPPVFSSLTRTVRPMVSLALAQGSLTGLAGGAPRLGLTLAVPTGQRPLTAVTISLPPGLRVAGDAVPAIRVLGTSTHFRFRLRTTRRTIEVICVSRTWGLRITLPGAVLRATPDLAAHIGGRGMPAGRLGLLVRERYGGRARVGMKLRIR